MQVEFRTKKLEKQYRESKQAIREYGEAVAKRYVQRINAIKHAKSIEEVRKSIRRINTRCDDLKDRIDAARERADDRFVQGTQHERDLAKQAQALDTIQQQVNNLVKLVGDLLKSRGTD